MKMLKQRSCSLRSPFLVVCCCAIFLATISSSVVVGGVGEEGGGGGVQASGPLVKREERRALVSTEYGQISAVRVRDAVSGSHLLHFITLEPNSLFLPVVLHADMVFYVHTGSGRLSWTEEDDLKNAELRRGDVYRLRQGSVFFIQSNLETETERQKLRIHAIFANSDNGLTVQSFWACPEPTPGPYSSIRDMVLGFDRKVLQAAFKVPEEVIDELFNGTQQPTIIHRVPATKRTAWETEVEFVRGLLASRSYNIFELNRKKRKESARLFNLIKEDKDFENCNGWSTTVTRKKLSALKGSNVGLFMVNLTAGSMMGPHWNPRAAEIAVVLRGRGMVRVVCSSISNETGCRNMRFEVEEGDVFVVPRFHPMAQMSFNNETLVFMGFSTSTKKNHPQFLAGQASVLRTLDKDVLAMSFNVMNATLDQLLAQQHDSVILGCISCAEEELRIMEEEIERERQEAREREEEEARKREEERRREEEEARKREEEEARRREEEKRKREEEEERRRQEEEARKREEEEARRQEEEKRRREEEEERRRQEEEEEEERRRQEEEARKREEEAAKREEEEARRQEEEKRRQEEEEEEERRRQEEEERRRQEEETRKREEEAARKKEEERREEEARQEEEARTREEEEAAKREEEKRRQQEEEEEAERRGEEARQREKEAAIEREEAARREQEEARRREEEAARQEEEDRRQREEEEETRQREEEEAARQSEEEAARQREEEQEEGRQREEEHQHGMSEDERAAEEERRRQEETQREEEEARQWERRQEGGSGAEEEEQEWGETLLGGNQGDKK
ncbi:UNVERIFIED_CONTAM: Vicilin-like seed storage protein [Sesamum calycinum]|uniref:Vicilin-like seed storage protein n=1 Tax=Sesamum calycinum TaxID=2727403 RepID=A0AAW2MMC1_9LAMI